MKTKTSQTTRKNKYLRFGAGALLLSILFVFVFAGTIASSFAVQENLIQTGQIEANVADATVSGTSNCYHDTSSWTNSGGASVSGTTTTLPNVYATHSASLSLSNSNWTTAENDGNDPLDDFDETNNSAGIKAWVTNQGGANNDCYTRRTLVSVSNISNISSIVVSFSVKLTIKCEAGKVYVRSRFSLGDTQKFVTDETTETTNSGRFYYGSQHGQTSSTNGKVVEYDENSSLTIDGSYFATHSSFYINAGMGVWSDGNIGWWPLGSKYSEYTFRVTSMTITVNVSNSVTFNTVPTTGGGTVALSNGAGSNNTISGSNISYEKTTASCNAVATPATGYEFVGWRYNDNIISTSANETFYGYNLPSGSTVFAVFMQGDFGKLSSAQITELYGSGHTSDTWGSRYNPFVISDADHLSNLANIVNGTQRPYDSVYGTYPADHAQYPSQPYSSKSGVTGSTTAARDLTYSGCYFILMPASGTTLDATSLSTPIGTSSTNYFAGTFDGGSNTINVSLTNSFN